MIKNEDTYCTVQHKIVREIGACEAVVYGTIQGLLRKTDGYGGVSNQTIMDMCRMNRKSLSRYIDKLIQAGYIEKVSGDGRGNISIYYISKKGDKMTTFSDEKGGQNDPKRGTNLPIKGDKMTPINKGENKEINKESGGDNAHEARDPHALSNTTPLNFDNMEDFNLFWSLYPGDPNWQGEKENCERVWFAMSQEWRDRLIQQLRDGKRWRVRENDNPYWYLKNYNGEAVKGELPFVRQGTVAFDKWHSSNEAAGIRMCLLHFDGRVACCLYSDLQTMLGAGARLLNDNWK